VPATSKAEPPIGDNGMYIHSIPAPVVFMFALYINSKRLQFCTNVRMLSVYFTSFVVFGD